MNSDVQLPSNPSWIRNLIIYQLRIDEFSPDGTLSRLSEKVPYLKDLGINAVWLTPVYAPNIDPVQGNCPGRFCNFDVKEPHLLYTEYGTNEEFKDFVAKCHLSDIRVLLETVPHGVTFNSTLTSDHPDWFKRSDDDEIIGSWGMADFNWDNGEFCKYWINTMTNCVIEYDVDGFRCDLEPHITGYQIWHEVIRKCLEQGKEIVAFSELSNTRENCYHFEQVGVGDIHPTQGSGDFFLENNIVDSIKSGKGISCDGKAQYITFSMSDHDSFCYHSRMSRLRFGYEMLFAPVIPLWFGGEEFGNETTKGQMNRGVLFFNKINWDKIESKKNRKFLTEIKDLIAIRNNDLNVFAPDGRSILQSNIVKIDSNLPLQAYARTGDNFAYIIAGMPGSLNPLWEFEHGKWEIEYGSLSQRNTAQKESIATLKQPFEALKEISFSTTTKICPDKDMNGFGGILFGRKGADAQNAITAKISSVRNGYFVGICANNRVFITHNGKLIAEKQISYTPQQEVRVKLTFADKKGRILIEGENSSLEFPMTDNPDGYFSFVTSRAHVHFNDLTIKAKSVFKDDFTGKAVKYMLIPDFTSLGMKKNGIYRITDLINHISYERVVQNGLLQIKGKIPGNEILVLKLECVK